METIIMYCKVVSILLFSALSEFLGVYDGLLHVLVVFAAIDYITGILRGMSERRLSSEIGAKGIVKKVAMFSLVGIANLIDAHIVGSEHLVRSATLWFYISNEGVSIIENSAALGLPIPTRLTEVLKQIKGKE